MLFLTLTITLTLLTLTVTVRVILTLPTLPGAQPRLKSWGGPRFGYQHRGACAPRPAKGRARCWVREEVAPYRCDGPGISPWKIFENSDAISCILVTTSVYFLCNFLLFENYGQEVGGAIHCWSPNVKVGAISLPRSLRLLRLWLTLLTLILWPLWIWHPKLNVCLTTYLRINLKIISVKVVT